eukprot:TRINITY_DN1618_c0_g1_i2.p1 TRINITY_DN1618_c0_g1~~TRINITY_DN1618_c0_g1_i2.p1  ORF type:complete len:325 (+),score=24.93 TRINITY_DN1618_c0_g1_i2:52-1026(+)
MSVVILTCLVVSDCRVQDLVLRIHTEVGIGYSWGKNVLHGGRNWVPLDIECTGNYTESAGIAEDGYQCTVGSIDWMRSIPIELECNGSLWQWTPENLLIMKYCMYDDLEFRLANGSNPITFSGLVDGVSYGIGLNTTRNYQKLNLSAAAFLPSGVSVEVSFDRFEPSIVRCIDYSWQYYHPIDSTCSGTWETVPRTLGPISDCNILDLAVSVRDPSGLVNTYNGEFLRQHPLFLSISGCDFFSLDSLETGTLCTFSLSGYTTEYLRCSGLGKWKFDRCLSDGGIIPYPGVNVPPPSRLCAVSDLVVQIIWPNATTSSDSLSAFF